MEKGHNEQCKSQKQVVDEEIEHQDSIHPLRMEPDTIL